MYRSDRSPDWLKSKDPACLAVKREAGVPSGEARGRGGLGRRTRRHPAVKREEEEDWK